MIQYIERTIQYRRSIFYHNQTILKPKKNQLIYAPKHESTDFIRRPTSFLSQLCQRKLFHFRISRSVVLFKHELSRHPGGWSPRQLSAFQGKRRVKLFYPRLVGRTNERPPGRGWKGRSLAPSLDVLISVVPHPGSRVRWSRVMSFPDPVVTSKNLSSLSLLWFTRPATSLVVLPPFDDRLCQ